MDLADVFRNVPIRFGLRQQGHLPTIRAMLARGESWEAIGRAINWHPATAREWYAREAGPSDEREEAGA